MISRCQKLEKVIETGGKYHQCEESGTQCRLDIRSDCRVRCWSCGDQGQLRCTFTEVKEELTCETQAPERVPWEEEREFETESELLIENWGLSDLAMELQLYTYKYIYIRIILLESSSKSEWLSELVTMNCISEFQWLLGEMWIMLTLFSSSFSRCRCPSRAQQEPPLYYVSAMIQNFLERSGCRLLRRLRYLDASIRL